MCKFLAAFVSPMALIELGSKSPFYFLTEPVKE